MVKKKKSKKDEFEVKMVDKFDDEDFFDDCPVCRAMKAAQKNGRQLSMKEMKNALNKAKNKGAVVGGELMGPVRSGSNHEILNSRQKTSIPNHSEKLKSRSTSNGVEGNGLEHIGNAKDFKMPKWMECTWRRVPCGKDDCPICGRIKRDRQKHIERGEDPDDFENTIEDVSQNFIEALEIIKKDAESKGFDITNIENIQEPPKPEEFPLYNKVEEWNKSVRVLEDTAEALGEFWLGTEEAADLFWYANILLARTYRQLCNRWHIKNGDDYGKFDHQYTGYVLKECLETLKKSLKELVSNYPQKQELNSIYSNLLKLEKQITKI